MAAHQEIRRLLHRFQIQRDREAVHIFPLKDAGRRTVPDPVFIGLGYGVQSGMKPKRNLFTG